MSGDARPVHSLHPHAFAPADEPHASGYRPVRIAAHAFGNHRPSRDLHVSPTLGICFDGPDGEVLIPAATLVNGATVQHVTLDKIVYWRIALDHPDILLAENLPCESDPDAGYRSVSALTNTTKETGDEVSSFRRPLIDAGPTIKFAREALDLPPESSSSWI